MILAQSEVAKLVGVAALKGIGGDIVKRGGNGSIEPLVDFSIEVTDDVGLVLRQAIENAIDDIDVGDLIKRNNASVTPVKGVALASRMKNAPGR